MTHPLALMSLGQAGATYVKDSLHLAGPLPAQIATEFNSSEASFAMLPTGTSTERAIKFREGHDMPMGASNDLFGTYIAEHWGTGCQLAFADPWMVPTDFAKFPPQVPYFWSDDNIYYMPTATSLAQKLTTGMRETRQFLWLGFVIDAAAFLPASGSTVEQDVITQLAQHTRAVFAAAYDWESYVVWEK